MTSQRPIFNCNSVGVGVENETGITGTVTIKGINFNPVANLANLSGNIQFTNAVGSGLKLNVVENEFEWSQISSPPSAFYCNQALDSWSHNFTNNVVIGNPNRSDASAFYFTGVVQSGTFNFTENYIQSGNAFGLQINNLEASVGTSSLINIQDNQFISASRSEQMSKPVRITGSGTATGSIDYSNNRSTMVNEDTAFNINSGTWNINVNNCKTSLANDGDISLIIAGGGPSTVIKASVTNYDVTDFVDPTRINSVNFLGATGSFLCIDKIEDNRIHGVYFEAATSSTLRIAEGSEAELKSKNIGLTGVFYDPSGAFGTSIQYTPPGTKCPP